MESKYCPACKTIRLVADFPRNRARSDGLGGYCHECQTERAAQTRRKKRAEVLAVLGGVCLRCGFDDPRALEVDHVNGGGTIEREQMSASSAVLLRRIKESPDEYQLLCANCHEIKKCENAEWVGRRRYNRVAPTDRIIGIGRGNGEAQRKNIGASWWASASPEQIAERNRKISEKRSGTRKVNGTWVK